MFHFTFMKSKTQVIISKVDTTLYCNTTCDNNISIPLPDQTFNINNLSKLYMPLTHPNKEGYVSEPSWRQ